MGDSLIELEILRQRISELEGTITESLEEFYHTIKYIHGLLFKVRKRQDGHSVFTMFEGMIVRDLLRSQENVIGKTMHELFPLATAAEIEKQLEQAYDGKSVQFKLMYGTSLYCITLTPVFKNGYAAEIIGSAIDMTDLHRMETERLHMIEDFKQTLQLLPNAVFKCRSRDDGKFTLTLNEGSLAVESGLTTEQVLGKSIEELFDEANATAIIKAYTRAFAGETVEFLTENDNRYFHNFVKPVYEQDSDGSTRVKELVGFHSEITEKKMIEDKFQEVVRAIAAETGDALFHTLVNQLTHVLDVDGVILGRMLPHEQGAMQTIATYTKGGTCDNFTTNIQYLLNKQRLQAGWMTEGNDLPHYLFAGTPLSKLQLGWYMAFPLLQGNQELSGVLIVINSKPADEIKMKVIRSMGMLFSLRASAELERTLAEEELVKSNTLLKATQESLLDGILIVNEERQVIGKNRRLLELWEIPSELSDETDECKFLDYIFSKIENGYALFRKILHLSFDSPTVAREEVILTDGRVIDMYAQAALTESGEPFARIWYFRDITEQKRNEEQIKHQAYFDVLTGLPNRMLFHDRLSQSISQAMRNHTKLAVIFLNLDRFKIINETLSHTIGDYLLKEVSRRLANCLHKGDTLSRLGSDEFKIILPELEQGEQAAKVAQQIMSCLSYPFHIEGHELHITASMGISLYPDDGTDNKTLVMNANAAMNRAKANGGNNYQLYTPTINRTAFEKLSLENDLRKAVERQELLLYYQPRVNLQNNLVVGMEALIRWQHPTKGRISPAAFIPLAEETDLIVQIDRYVLKMACRQAKQWQEAGYPPLRLAVNVSARHFQQSNLVETVATTLEETGLQGEFLELEITESTTMSDAEAAISTIRRLKELGVHIAIDDFGTGYSSLSYLKKFPIDTLKIDQSFVREISVDWDDAAIVSYIISLGHSLQLNVIAEGVETEEQRRFLEAGKCNEMQGYLFSPPVTPDQFEMILQENRAKTYGNL